MQGGEIFVPKIASMKIVDLAKAMAPKLPLKIIGIRPGEKLHEIMITEDDAVNTLEYSDRYVVTPPFFAWHPESYLSKGQKVPERFAYSSNTNNKWLNSEDFHAMLNTNKSRSD
jgi:UDP-N-acetylglucosamine 4,6-dehydratase/5-epimerase